MKKEGCNGNGEAHGELYSPYHAVDVKTDTHTNNQAHLYAPQNALHINNKRHPHNEVEEGEAKINKEEGEAKINIEEEEEEDEKRNPKSSSKL